MNRHQLTKLMELDATTGLSTWGAGPQRRWLQERGAAILASEE